jgi:hypothetical protein
VAAGVTPRRRTPHPAGKREGGERTVTIQVEIDPADLRAFKRAGMVPNRCFAALARAMDRVPLDEVPYAERCRPGELRPGVQRQLEGLE